jgi:hypothetical protein
MLQDRVCFGLLFWFGVCSVCGLRTGKYGKVPQSTGLCWKVKKAHKNNSPNLCARGVGIVRIADKFRGALKQFSKGKNNNWKNAYCYGFTDVHVSQIRAGYSLQA